MSTKLQMQVYEKGEALCNIAYITLMYYTTCQVAMAVSDLSKITQN